METRALAPSGSRWRYLKVGQVHGGADKKVVVVVVDVETAFRAQNDV